jgi:polyisoprenoid-binding protein YceI
MKDRRWLWAIPVAVVVLVLGGTWFYINVIEGPAPEPLAFSSSPTTTAAPGTTAAPATPATPAAPASAGPIEGTWKPTSSSQAGYRVKEVLFGQSATAVGRTNAVTGQLVIQGTKVNAADFTVDLTKVSSDQSRRDGQFQGRIMDTRSHPNATFKLTKPIDLGNIPGDQQEGTYNAVGDLTLRSTTKSVTFPLKARRNGGNIEVNGTIPITFADWSIPNPSFGPADTDDHGELEFLLVFARG